MGEGLTKKELDELRAAKAELEEIKKLEKERKTKKPDEAEKITVDEVSDEEIKKLAEGEGDEYKCGSCGHIEAEEFSPCPECKKKLEW